MRKTRLSLAQQLTRRTRGVVGFRFDTKRQKLIAYKWPRKRGPGTPAQQAARAAFGNVAHTIMQQPWQIIEMARALSKGTDYLWRDLLMSAAYGNLLVAEDGDGNQWAGQQKTMLSIQTLLNSLGTTLGSMLVYATGGWQTVTPGTEGQVLTVQESGLPDWQDPATITLAQISAALDLITDAHGAVLFRGTDEWTALAPGTAGYVLSTNGDGEDPSWIPMTGGGGGSTNNWGEALLVEDSAGHDIPSAGIVLLCNGAGGQTLTMPSSPTDGDVCRVLSMNLSNISGMQFTARAGQSIKGYVTAASGGTSSGQTLEGYDMIFFYWNAATSTWWSSHFGY